MNRTLASPDHPQIKGRTVMVVDDNLTDVRIMSHYLEEYGLEVLDARDGEEGLAKVRHAQPDLILLNAEMPGTDGFETCRRLKADKALREIPVILMMAPTEIENKVRGFQLGAADYLAKPVQHEEVLARVATHLRLRSLSRELQETKETLEKHAEEQMAELARANRKLRAEVARCKTAEDAYRESEELHRTTLESILDPVFITDDNGEFTFICSNVFHILGYTVEEIQGMGSISKLVGDGLFDLEELKTLGQIHNIETVILDKCGRDRCFLTSVKQVSIKKGTVLYTCHDITERRQAEQALAESRSRLHAILSSMRDLVFVFDKQGRFTYCYAPEEKLYLSTDAFIGRKHREVMPTHIDRLFNKAFSQCKEGEVAEYEYQLQIDGKTKWFAAQLSPLLLDEEVAGAVAVVRDITERKDAEEALRRSLQDTARGQKLLLALGQAAQAVQRARTHADVYRTVGDELIGLGYHAVIYTPTDDHGYLDPSYWTLDPIQLRQAQELLDFSLLDAHLAITPDGLCERALGEERPLFFDDITELIVGFFPELPRLLAKQLAVLIGPGQAICSPLSVGGKVHGLLMVFGSDLREADLIAVTIFANQATIALESAWLLEAVTRHKEDLQRLSKEILDAQEAERKRISLELHDELGQALTAIGINLEELEKALPPEVSPRLKERLAETTDLADETLEQVREMALGLRPSLLDDLGLVPALRWYISQLAQRLTIEIGFEAVDCGDRLPMQVETALYRIVQEALTNIIRHAEASYARVRLECTASTIVTTIEDDGQGFDVEAAASRGGVGLLGMRERAALLGGSVSIDSQPGRGTRLTLEIPWN